MSSRLKALAVAIAIVGTASTLAGCASDVPMTAAPNANDPACADVVVRLPPSVAGFDRRYTNAQSTGSWGDPSAVLLYCGTEPSGPTTDRCVNVNGVDWVIDGSEAPLYRFEAYGRTPGLQVIVDSDHASGTEAVLDLSSIVKTLPQERQCTSLTDELELPEG